MEDLTNSKDIDCLLDFLEHARYEIELNFTHDYKRKAFKQFRDLVCIPKYEKYFKFELVEELWRDFIDAIYGLKVSLTNEKDFYIAFEE